MMPMNSITEGDVSRYRNVFDCASEAVMFLLQWRQSSMDGPLIYGKPLRLCVTVREQGGIVSFSCSGVGASWMAFSRMGNRSYHA